MTVKRYILVAVLSCLAAGMVAVIVFFDPEGNTFLARELYNLGHFPFFALLAAVIHYLLLNIFEKNRSGPLRFYLFTFILTAAIGIAQEFAQIEGPRDANIGDFSKDLMGAVSFLGIYFIYDWRITNLSEKRKKIISHIVIISVAFITIIAVLPVALWGAAYWHRNNTFPVVCDFSSYWQEKFIEAKDAEVNYMESSGISWLPENGGICKLTLHRAKYPGIAILEPYPDWTGYGFLEFCVYSENDTDVKLTLRIADQLHNNEYDDRFNRTLAIEPGSNRIRIPLEDIRTAPAAREMDLSMIGEIRLFVYDLSETKTLYLDDFHLEKERSSL